MSRIDHKSGFGFNTNSDGNKKYFIKRNNIEYQVNLDQLPFYIQQNLGLIPTQLSQPVGGFISSLDNNTGLIYSINNSIQTGPFSIFDPVSRYGFIGTRKDTGQDFYYFYQDSNGGQSTVTSYNIPEDVKNLLQTGIKNHISQDFILPIYWSTSEETLNIIINENPNIIEEEDKTKGFGFDIDSDGNKNYFINRNFVNHQVNLEQIPLDIQENLGLRDRDAPIPRGASFFSFDSNTGLIYSINRSIRGTFSIFEQRDGFSIFDPESRYGFNANIRDNTFYFTQNKKGIQSKVASYFLPENVKTLLQTGITNNLTSDFTLPDEKVPSITEHDPRCPSKCFKCECNLKKKKLNQSKFDLVKNNPDPKYPKGCSTESCKCKKCKQSITPRPEGLTDPKGPSTFTPSITPRPEGLTGPSTFSPALFGPALFGKGKEEIFSSFWEQYNYIILGIIALIIIIIIFFFFSFLNSGKKEEEE